MLKTKFARNTLLGGVALPVAIMGIGNPLSSSAAAQTAPPTSATNSDAPDQSAADIVVTGTLARRTNTETPSPVTVLTADTLSKAGITDVTNALRTVSADSAGSISTGFQNGFSAGGAAVSLRGLGVSSTLVLIDGLRSANYPLNDDGHNAYTDLNSIPFGAIDRVEVLKDGASSLYGADAIGGVLNIITKRKFVGIAGTVEGGVSERGDAGKYRGTLTAGVGDYASAGWNFYVNAEFQRNNPVISKDRGFPFNTYDLSSIGGTDDNRFDDSLTTATTNAVVVRTTQTDLNNPLAGGVGAPLTNQYISLNLNCANGTYTITTGAARGTGCKHNNAYEQGQIAPLQERYSFSGRLSFKLGDAVEGYITGSYSHNRVYLQSRGGASGKAGSLASRALRDNQPFGASPGLSSANPGIVLPVYVCASGVNCATSVDRRLNPNNPFAAAFAGDPGNGAARIYYLFGDIPYNIDRNYRVLRGTAGLRGTIAGGFDWKVDAGGTETKLVVVDNGFINVANVLKAINTGAYNFVDPSQNTAAVRNSIAPTTVTPSFSSLYSLDASISKNLVELPGGPLLLAVGGQIRREQLTNNSRNPGLQLYNQTTSAAFGKHTVSAAYFEIDAPVLDQLEVNLSGRYDHYSEGFSHFSPKAGFKFTPIPQIALRGTFSKGFRAPTFAENDPRSSFAGFSTYNPLTSACNFVIAHGGSALAGGGCTNNGNAYSGSYSSGQALQGNPNLKPELSRSITAGLIFQPARWFNLTIDYYDVKKTNVIVAGPLFAKAQAAYFGQSTLDAAKAAVAAVGPGYSVNLVDGADPAFPGALPRVLIINTPYVNGASVTTSGLDIEATARIPLASGVRFTSRVSVSDIFKYDFNPGGGAGVQRYVGTIGPYQLSSGAGTPKWRGNWQNTVEFGDFTLNATAYYVSRIKNVAADTASTNNLSCADNLYTNPSGDKNKFCYINSFITVDLNASIRVNDKFDFFMNVGNVLGARAPIAPSAYSGINYLPSWHYAGVVGRTFSAGANFKF